MNKSTFRVIKGFTGLSTHLSFLNSKDLNKLEKLTLPFKISFIFLKSRQASWRGLFNPIKMKVLEVKEHKEGITGKVFSAFSALSAVKKADEVIFCHCLKETGLKNQKPLQ
jgi:hypothetical protein